MRNKPTKTRGVYWRGDVLWIRYAGPDGKIVRESAHTGDLRLAKRTRRERISEVADGTWQPAGKRRASVLTVSAYADEWLPRQEARGVRSHRVEAQKLRDHVLPLIGDMRLDAVRPKHVIDMVTRLKQRRTQTDGTPLAPRVVINAYQVFRRMMRDAVIEELIVATPCVLPSGTLPKKRDKDPRWRERSVYQRGEVEALISDERIPWDDRVVWALIFLLGVRPGEAAGLRWEDYDTRPEPLGRMLIATQGDGQRLKTETPRQMPVHPTLAAILAEWRLSGFAAHQGRPPRPSDYIVPTGRSVNQHGRLGEVRVVGTQRAHMKRDLATLGLRTTGRAQHSGRATLITLALEDGAQREILRSCTHGDTRDAFDLYSRFSWAAKCAEVAKLRVQRVTVGEIAEIDTARG